MTDDFQAAKKELEISLSQEHSSKSAYYLDRTRTAILKRLKTKKTGPELIVSYPKKTRDVVVILSGHVKDKHYVTMVAVGDRKILVEPSKKYISLKTELTLKSGENDIMIMAGNLLGGETKRPIVIQVDRDGPMIVIRGVKPGENVSGH